MEISSTIYAKGMVYEATNNGPTLNRSNSRIECAGMCSLRDDCHYYSWHKDEKQCDMDSVEKGWHFNYTEINQGHEHIYMDTGESNVRQLDS